MNQTQLTTDERDLLESYERDEWQSVVEQTDSLNPYREIARATFRKDRRVNIRISEKDLIGLQKRALAEGIPYQTLMSSILHKYLAGTLVEKT